MEFNVYLVTNLVNGKMYVGKTTKTIEKRWSGHLAHARYGAPHPLQRAIRKYGPEAFTVEPILLIDDDFTDEANLNAGEILMIRLLRVNCQLYNCTIGGDGVSSPTDETRRKMSESHKGKTASEETRHKLSLAVLNQSPESRRRKSESARRRPPISEETHRKLCEVIRNRPRKTHCKHGHERTPDNVDRHGRCLKCVRIRNAARSPISLSRDGRTGASTHCIHGHERTPDNVNKRGQCLTCKRINNKNRRRGKA